MEIVSVKIGSPSQATKVNIEAPEQVKVTFKDVVINNGGGSVKSVNGQTGDVVLDAAAVGALPNTTKIPANTSDLINNSGFITKTVSDLTNYYLKSETYSREKIDNKISAIPKFNIKVVTSLPTTGISKTTVYLVKSGDDSSNLYTEYIYVNGKWEILGKQTVDLSEYALKKDIPVSLADLEQDTNHRTVTDEEKNFWNSAEPNLVNAIFMNGAEVEPNEEGIVDLGALIHSDGIGGDPRGAHLRVKAKETLYTVPYIRPNGTIGPALLPLASATGQGAITAAQFSKLEGIDEGATKVTSENIEKALGYTPADQTEVEQLSDEIVNLSLGMGEDGRVYLLNNGVAQGNGIEIPSGGASGDVVGNMGENNVVILTGNLTDGTYTFVYKMEDGTQIEIGTKELTDEPVIRYTNKIPTAVNTDGTAFSSTGIQNGKRWSSSGTLSSGQSNTTGLIACKANDIVYLQKCGLYNKAGTAEAHRVTFWNTSKGILGYEQPWKLTGTYMTDVQWTDGFITQFKVEQDGFFAVSGINATAASALGVTEVLDTDSIITINEPIV